MKNKSAFTLVELIVVITILAILWTIAFISLQWYSSTARNSVRVSDVVNVSKWLELNKIKKWFYEFPENYETFTWTLTKTLKQWELWEKLLTNIWITNNVKDPLTEEKYKYSVYWNWEYYQIAYELEENIFSSNIKIINNLTAEETNKEVKIKWNYEIDPSLPSLIVIPETVTWSWIFDPEVCFILEWWNNTFESTWTDCEKKKEMNLKDFDAWLVWYWDMETLTGSLLKDLSWNGNNCTFSWTSISTWTWWIVWNSLTFNWTWAFLDCWNSESLNPKNAFTIIININSRKNELRWILTKQSSRNVWTCNNAWPSWFWYCGYRIATGIDRISWREYSYSSTLTWLDQTYNAKWINYVWIWTQAVFSLINLESWKMYINWSNKNIENKSISILTHNNYPLLIWRYWNDHNSWNSYEFFDWIIDEVKIYNRALSDSEIKQQSKITGF